MDPQTVPVPQPHRRIVVGVDGSNSSIGALRRGARIAAALHTRLEAVAVWRYPDVYGGYMGETVVPDSGEFSGGAQAMIDESATAVFGTEVPPWFHGSVREGGTAQVLIDESKDAEMLVVGSRGHGGFAGLLLGSVSEAVAEHASCPVLVFHDDAALKTAS
jgi:nucleotide-binding universal stress UspA family protein